LGNEKIRDWGNREEGIDRGNACSTIESNEEEGWRRLLASKKAQTDSQLHGALKGRG